MFTLPTMETAILDRAHLVGIAAPEHLGHKVIIVARIITRTKLFERDRFELSYATRLNRAAGLYVGWRP